MRIRMARGLGVFLVGMVLLGAVGLWRWGGDAKALWEYAAPRLADGGIVLGAALLHEVGHLVAAWGVGVRVRGIRLDLLGARMELGGLLSYGQELFIAAAGPLAGFLGAALAYPLWAKGGMEGAALFSSASAVLSTVNLLPVGTLDGGRMMTCAVSGLWGERAGRVASQITTMVFAVALWMVAAYALLRAGQMLSLFVFAACLLGRVGTKEGFGSGGWGSLGSR